MLDDWPGAQVEMRSIADLRPYKRNPRKHSPAQLKQLARSIREWGFTIPVLIDEDDMILAGHGRVAAARQIRLQEVPCMVARGWSDAKKRAYVIADNKLTLNSEWDDDLLAAEIAAIQETEPLLDLVIGFDDRELRKLTGSDDDFSGDAPVDHIDAMWTVIVDCGNEQDQVALIRRLQAEGYRVKASVG